jgi:4'-phosphopantetheinyl transferase
MKSLNHQITKSSNETNTIFAVNIENLAELFDDGLCLIKPAMQQDVLRFRQKKDKHRKLVSSLLLRFLIKNFLNLPEYNLSIDSFGKPHLQYYPDFQFNMSHSGDWVVGAVSDKPLGIDIELIRELNDFIQDPTDCSKLDQQILSHSEQKSFRNKNRFAYMDIAKRFYSEKEYAFLMKCEEKSRLVMFYDIWTKKESLIKAVGKGLSIPLKSFTVPLESHGRVLYKGNVWRVHSLVFDDKCYKMSLCLLSTRQLFSSVRYVALNELIKQ